MKSVIWVGLLVFVGGCSGHGFKASNEITSESLATKGCHLSAPRVSIPLGATLTYWTVSVGSESDCARASRKTTCVAPGLLSAPLDPNLPFFSKCEPSAGDETDLFSRLPQIVSFRGSVASINPGEPVTLSWQTRGATSAQISGIGLVPTSGALTLFPMADTSYNLLAINTVGAESAVASVAVTNSSLTGP